MMNSFTGGLTKIIYYSGLIFLAGLLLNYAVEYRTFGDLPDLFLTTTAFAAMFTGVVLLIIALTWRSLRGNLHKSIVRSLLIAAPFTLLYGLFYFGMQFIQTGANRYGQCDGIDKAASNTNIIPVSIVMPPRAAVGCGSERYGVFLTPYNQISVWGVHDRGAQNRVLQALSLYHKTAHTYPLRVTFYDKENWSPLIVKNGQPWGGQRGPEKVIRVASLR